MAIVLITGLPGHGKTLYTIDRYRQLAEKEGRPVYQHGINGLKLPWSEHKPQDWEALPPNAIFIVDEAQFVFPLRGKGSPAEWIQRLAVHRHAGIDLVLITQDPLLIDSFVRRLCDRHFHVVRKFGTHFATVHEYANGVRDRVAASRGDSIKHEWKYPKDVFELYHSAEVHTVKARIPLRVWVLVFAPLLVIGLAWSFYSRRVAPQEPPPKPPAVGSPLVQGTPGVSAGQARAGGQVKPMTPQEYMASYTPRLPGLAHTAPAYDQVTQPAEAPYPAACVASEAVCRCYSQQGTRLQTPDEMCRSITAGGFFVAWRGPGQGQQVAQAAPVAPAGHAATLAPGAHTWNAGEVRASLPQVTGGGQAAAPRR